MSSTVQTRRTAYEKIWDSHVVVAHHVAGSPPCHIHARNPSTLRSIARNLVQAHGLPMASSTLGNKHKAVLHATRNRTGL